RERVSAINKNISDEEVEEILPEALKILGLRLLKDSIDRTTKRVRENLPHVVAMIIHRILQGTILVGDNDLRDVLNVPEQKRSAREIKDGIFQPDWERIK